MVERLDTAKGLAPLKEAIQAAETARRVARKTARDGESGRPPVQRANAVPWNLLVVLRGRLFMCCCPCCTLLFGVERCPL